MITDQGLDTHQVPDSESSAAHGALWVTVGTVAIGLSNYGYSLLLTRLLTVADYSVFSAGQSLILWATNVATVSVPWVLAQALARARSKSERNSAIRFAKLLSAGTGVVAGLIAGGIATGVSGPEIAVVVAVSTFAIFLGTTTTGWLQGDERMRSLSLLYLAENALKNVAGIALVMVAGLKGVGALAGFGFGALVMLARWPRTWRDGNQSWRDVVNKELLRTAMATAGAQGLVSLFIALDVVLIALLPGNRALAASYQASTTLTRIPLYIAGAIATAYFPSLSRSSSNGVIAAQAVRLYAAAGLPIMAILATVPDFFVGKIFPSQYGDVGLMLKYTAVTGLAAGGISLVTTFFQAANEYSCLKLLAGGLAGYVVALLTGWRIAGVLGFAVGGALGSMIAFMLMGYLLVRRRGLVILAWVRLVEPALAGVVLVVARAYWPIWLLAAFVFGLRAVMHFLRPGSRHEKLPRWATPRGAVMSPVASVTSLLIDAIWRENVIARTDEELNDMLVLGRLNGVEGRLAQLYPRQLAGVLSQVREDTELYAAVLRVAAWRLQDHGIPAVLIEEGLSGFRSRENIDLVIPRQYWGQLVRVLPDKDFIYVQQTDGILFQPLAGPIIHIHPDLSWLGVQFLGPNRLIARGVRTGDGMLVPSRADYLRVLLGQALCQQRELDLSQLFVLWGLMRRPVLIMAARAEAEREGWLRGFEDILALVGDSINRLTQRQEISLPVRPPVLASVHRHRAPRARRRGDRRVRVITATQTPITPGRSRVGWPMEHRPNSGK